jgi:hypothetical protein
MRQRGADSPDVFDAIAIIVDMLRSKKNFASKAKAVSGFIGTQVSGGARSAWSKILSRYGVQKQAARVLVR